MAAYRFSAKVIGRSGGRSATAAAAYRAGIEMTDERTGLTHDYSRRSGVVHAEILMPDGAPAWMANRERLWNAAEQAERRKDAQIAREIQMNIPHELDDETRRALVRDFVQEQFVSRGMVADIAIHAPHEQGDNRNHHSHVMLTLRGVNPEGFNKTKTAERSWNSTELLQEWRERWAEHQNLALERAGFDIRVDHRSLEDQGINREPEPKLGPIATQMERNGRPSHAGDDLRNVWTQNAERERLQTQEIILDLQIARESLTEAREGQKHPEGARYHFNALYEAQRASLQERAAEYEQQIADLSEQVEGRNRIAVFWDKLRGRLGWNAELDLEAKRQSLQDAQERADALEVSYAQQRRTAAHEAEMSKPDMSRDERRQAYAREFDEGQVDGREIDGDGGIER